MLHSFLHFVGLCPDAKMHIDLLDLLLFAIFGGFSFRMVKVYARAAWIVFAREVLGRKEADALEKR